MEGILAVFYGRRVLLFMKDNGLVIISIVAAIAVVGLLVYVVINRWRSIAARRAASAVESEK